jgi:hypothetical protein
VRLAETAKSSVIPWWYLNAASGWYLSALALPSAGGSECSTTLSLPPSPFRRRSRGCAAVPQACASVSARKTSECHDFLVRIRPRRGAGCRIRRPRSGARQYDHLARAKMDIAKNFALKASMQRHRASRSVAIIDPTPPPRKKVDQW